MENTAATTTFRRFLAFLACNFALSLLICAAFLLYTGGHPLELVYAAAALVSNTGMLYLLLFLPALALFSFGRGLPAGVLLAAFQMFLVTDVAIYKIFKFHLNSMVLNIVLTPGGLESLDQGWGTKALFFLILGGLGFAQWKFLRLAEGLAGRISGRGLKLFFAALLAFVLADKGLFVWATLADKPYITRDIQLFPLYQPLRVRSFAAKHFGVRLDKEAGAGIDAKYSGLAYPKAPLNWERPAKPLNFLFIVVDSMRADMLTPDVMPETWALGKRSAVFANHYSGGNCTRFGIFTMLYGIYGNYWFPMLGERRGPLLIDLLKEQGYDLRVYASAKLSFPEFNKTCFAAVPRADIYDEPAGANGIERDADISDRFIRFVKERKAGKPYFGFLFYDASHGNYDPLPGFEKFQPAYPVAQIALNRDKVVGLKNRYKNSIYSDDHLVGRIVKAVEAAGGLKDTVILVLGDHGEAFLERGRYGHNQGYSPEEVRVPLVLFVPGRKPERVTVPTSHLDIVPTLFRLAGVKNPAEDYSSGRSLLEPAPRPFLPAASWDTAGVFTQDRILELPLEAYKGGVKVFDTEYRELQGEAKKQVGTIGAFQKEAKRFYK